MRRDMNTLDHVTPLADRLYLASLVRSLRAQHVVEVGCYVGLTTRSLVDATPDVTVHCVDHFEGVEHDDNDANFWKSHSKDEIRRTFCENLADVLFSRVFLHEGPSETWAALWPYPVDLVYLDADHGYEAVKRDIEIWRPHVKQGGILCGHDYGIYEGVTRAVDELKPDAVKGFVWMKWV